MTYKSIYSLRDHVWHRFFPELNGYIEEVSIDAANILWAKIVLLRDNEVVGSWLRQADLTSDSPSVGFSKEG